jgi:peptide methionine sulfoxide reductase MsrB
MSIPASDDEWREKLTPEQYQVLRKHGTERAGSSALNKEHRDGVMRSLWSGAVHVGHEIRQRHGLAKLLGAD